MFSTFKALIAASILYASIATAEIACDAGQIAVGRLNGARGQPGVIFTANCIQIDSQIGDRVGPCGGPSTYAGHSSVQCDVNGAPTEVITPDGTHFNNCITINDVSCTGGDTILDCCSPAW